MLVRNLHFSYLPERGYFCAFLDFVDFDWSGPSHCSFGEVKNGADKIAGCVPNVVCLVMFRRRGRTRPRIDNIETSVCVEAIDADLLYDIANNGGGVVYRSSEPEVLLPNEIPARSRHVLAHVCRNGVEPEQALDERNEIFRATQIVMRLKGWSEQDAFRLLRTLAMRRRQTLVSVSKQINRLGKSALERAA